MKFRCQFHRRTPPGGIPGPLITCEHCGHMVRAPVSYHEAAQDRYLAKRGTKMLWYVPGWEARLKSRIYGRKLVRIPTVAIVPVATEATI